MDDQMFCRLEDKVYSTNHTTKSVGNIEIDEDIVDLVETFMVMGGTSYCSCQGHAACIYVELTLFNPVSITPTDRGTTYDFGYEDQQILLEKPFVIIYKNDLHILEEACELCEWKIDKVIEGAGGYECDWIKDRPDESAMLFIVLKNNL